MKAFVVLLGLITATLLSGKGTRDEERSTVAETRVIVRYHPQLTGVAAVTVKIRAYNATGELDTRRDPFTLGTRVLLTCDVTGIPEGSEVVGYRWFHNCTELQNYRCIIEDKNPYYKVVKDTILVDVTSLNQGGRYYCNVPSLSVTDTGITRELTVAG